VDIPSTKIQDKVMSRFVLYSKNLLIVLAMVSAFCSPAVAQSSVEIFQDKIIALEESMKEIRGIVEQDLRTIKLALQGSGDDNSGELSNKVDKLADQLAALNNRIGRTLQVATDNEFRLLRLEKRVNSALQIDDVLPVDGPDTQGAGEAPQSSLSVSANSQANWTIIEDQLDEEISNLPNPEDAQSGGAEVGEGETVEAETASSILPKASADEQYKFALGKALQNDLDAAEVALGEFVQLNPEHERTNDATFWLGRVQYMKSSHEKAAVTFSKFNENWPADPRREKTTLWLAESISYFAPTSEVCELLDSLPNLLADPTDDFYLRLDQLKAKAECTV
jgi:TolA-binding protein